MNNHHTFLMARIKLRKRHLAEWAALSNTQRMIWRFIEDKFAKKISLCADDKRACFQLKTEQATQLAESVRAHREVRRQMKLNHEYEFQLLEQSIDNSDESFP